MLSNTHSRRSKRTAHRIFDLHTEASTGIVRVGWELSGVTEHLH